MTLGGPCKLPLKEPAQTAHCASPNYIASRDGIVAWANWPVTGFAVSTRALSAPFSSICANRAHRERSYLDARGTSAHDRWGAHPNWDRASRTSGSGARTVALLLMRGEH